MAEGVGRMTGRSQSGDRAGGRFLRSGSGLEFDRVSFFSDAIYAIALTLIAVELRPPEIPDPSDRAALLDGLGRMWDQIWVYFVAFAVIGGYWLANHRFVAALDAIDATYTRLTVLYLAFVAFLPFPAAMMGDYTENAVAVSLFAVTMGIVSFVEWVQLRTAHRHQLFAEPMSPAVYRWESLGSLWPVALFAFSIPLMFLTEPWVGMVAWLVGPVVGFVLLRRYDPAQVSSEGAAT